MSDAQGDCSWTPVTVNSQSWKGKCPDPKQPFLKRENKTATGQNGQRPKSELMNSQMELNETNELEKLVPACFYGAWC